MCLGGRLGRSHRKLHGTDSQMQQLIFELGVELGPEPRCPVGLSSLIPVGRSSGEILGKETGQAQSRAFIVVGFWLDDEFTPYHSWAGICHICLFIEIKICPVPAFVHQTG